MAMSFVQYLLQLALLFSLCMSERFADATPAPKEKLACNTGTRCDCLGWNLTVLSCNVSNGLFKLPKHLPPLIRGVKIIGRNFSISIAKSGYGDSWQKIETIEIFGDDAEGDVRLRKTFTDKLRRTKLLRIKNAGLTTIDNYAFSNMTALEHLDLSNNAFLSITEVGKGLILFQSRTLKTFDISGIHSGKRMKMYNVYSSFFFTFSEFECFRY